MRAAGLWALRRKRLHRNGLRLRRALGLDWGAVPLATATIAASAVSLAASAVSLAPARVLPRQRMQSPDAWWLGRRQQRLPSGQARRMLEHR